MHVWGNVRFGVFRGIRKVFHCRDRIALIRELRIGTPVHAAYYLGIPTQEPCPNQIDRAVQSIMPVCRYAICPVPNCMGLVIPAYEPDRRKMFLELSRRWYLEVPAFDDNLVIADSELKMDEISSVLIGQTYPDKP